VGEDEERVEEEWLVLVGVGEGLGELDRTELERMDDEGRTEVSDVNADDPVALPDKWLDAVGAVEADDEVVSWQSLPMKPRKQPSAACVCSSKAVIATYRHGVRRMRMRSSRLC
jgi:hypothetical protein